MSAFPNGSSLYHGNFQRYPLNEQNQFTSKFSTKATVFSNITYPQQTIAENFKPERSQSTQRNHFSIFNATKETVKGILRPITTIIRHPLKSAFAIGATIAVTSAAPVTVPFMVLAGLGFGAAQTVKGIVTAAQQYRQGNYEASEKAFGSIGEGSFSLVSSLLGVRQAGTIAAEAKASSTALSSTASAAEKLKAVEKGLQAAERVHAGTWTHALKETASVLSPQGFKTLATQANPIRLGALAKGKAQSLISMFKESPTVDLNAAVKKAQRFLKIKDADMPEVVPSMKVKLPDGNQLSLPKNLEGAYSVKTHTLHIQPDRLKALQRLTGIPFERWPKPLQNFLGNWYKQYSPIQDLATHELTHAKQFLEVRKLSLTQARETLQTAYPTKSASQIEEALKQFTFLGQEKGQHISGNLLQTLRQGNKHTAKTNLEAGHGYLLESAKATFSALDEKTTQFASFNPLEILKSQKRLHRSYYRSGYEIEARQTAAQALIADAAKKLKQSKSIFKEQQLLKQYRTMRLEAKLNKILRQLNRFKQNGNQAAAMQSQQTLSKLAPILPHQTCTQSYLKMDQLFKQKIHITQQAQQQAVANGQSTISSPSIFTYVRSAIGNAFQWVKNLFSFGGIQRAEQQMQSLKPAYVTTNTYINSQAQQ